MSKKSENRPKVYEYDVRNPVSTHLAFPMKRWLRLTAQNYSTFPIILMSVVVVPGCFAWYVKYRVGNTPDMFYPGHNPRWDLWEHKHGKLAKVPEELLMAEHPRPRYEYQMPKEKEYLPTLYNCAFGRKIFSGKGKHSNKS